MKERRENSPCDINSKDIENLKKDIWGNGKQGLKIEVNTMKTKINFLMLGTGFIIAQLATIIVMMAR